MQQYDTVFFVDSMDSIKYYLSMNIPQHKVLFFLSEESKSLHKFLISILPAPKIVLIPDVSFLDFYKTGGDNHQKIIEFKQYLLKFLPLIHKLSIVFINVKIVKQNLLILLSNFIDKAQIFALGGGKDFLPRFIEEQNIQAQSRWHLDALAQILGYKVYAIDSSNRISIGLGPKSKEKISFKTIIINNWNTLVPLLDLNIEVCTNSVLLIDSPINRLVGFNQEKTKRSLQLFFARLSKESKRIYLKQHYECDSQGIFEYFFFHNHSSFEIKKLPGMYPVELIMNKFHEIYGFGCQSLKTPINGKKFSLGKHLEFDYAEGLYNFWSNIFEKNLTSCSNLKTKYSKNHLIELINIGNNEISNQEENIAQSIMLDYAEKMYKDGDKNYAIRILLRIVEECPECHIALNDLGVIFWELNKKELAKQYFDKAYRINPYDQNISTNILRIKLSNKF